MWLQILILVFLLLAMCFGLVLISGAPYLPTLKNQIDTIFDFAQLNPGDTIIELGCGDGRMLIAAAKRDMNAVGYELNPILFVICWLRTLRFRGKVTVKFADFWGSNWPNADAVYVFLLPRLMPALERKIIKEEPRGIKVISFAFDFPGLKPLKMKNGILLYEFTPEVDSSP